MISFILFRRTPHSVGCILLFICLVLAYIKRMTLKWVLRLWIMLSTVVDSWTGLCHKGDSKDWLIVGTDAYTKDYVLHWGHLWMMFLNSGFHGHWFLHSVEWTFSICIIVHHHHHHHIRTDKIFWFLCWSDFLLAKYVCL